MTKNKVRIFSSLIVICLYLFFAFGSSSGNHDRSDSDIDDFSTDTNSLSSSCMQNIETFFNEANILLYRVETHGKTVVLFIEEKESIGRPKGIAEIGCSFVTECGFDMISLRNSNGDTIARTMCK